MQKSIKIHSYLNNKILNNIRDRPAVELNVEITTVVSAKIIKICRKKIYRAPARAGIRGLISSQKNVRINICSNRKTSRLKCDITRSARIAAGAPGARRMNLFITLYLYALRSAFLYNSRKQLFMPCGTAVRTGTPRALRRINIPIYNGTD